MEDRYFGRIILPSALNPKGSKIAIGLWEEIENQQLKSNRAWWTTISEFQGYGEDHLGTYDPILLIFTMPIVPENDTEWSLPLRRFSSIVYDAWGEYESDRNLIWKLWGMISSLGKYGFFDAMGPQYDFFHRK